MVGDTLEVPRPSSPWEDTWAAMTYGRNAMEDVSEVAVNPIFNIDYFCEAVSHWTTQLEQARDNDRYRGNHTINLPRRDGISRYHEVRAHNLRNYNQLKREAHRIANEEQGTAYPFEEQMVEMGEVPRSEIRSSGMRMGRTTMQTTHQAMVDEIAAYRSPDPMWRTRTPTQNLESVMSKLLRDATVEQLEEFEPMFVSALQEKQNERNRKQFEERRGGDTTSELDVLRDTL